MPKFYFRQYMNGQQMAKDQEGREFASLAEACTYAVRRAPGLLRKTLSLDANTYLSTEISKHSVSSPHLPWHSGPIKSPNRRGIYTGRCAVPSCTSLRMLGTW